MNDTVSFFKEIPKEIIEKVILPKLSSKELLNVACTNKKMYHLAMNVLFHRAGKEAYECQQQLMINWLSKEPNERFLFSENKDVWITILKQCIANSKASIKYKIYCLWTMTELNANNTDIEEATLKLCDSLINILEYKINQNHPIGVNICKILGNLVTHYLSNISTTMIKSLIACLDGGLHREYPNAIGNDSHVLALHREASKILNTLSQKIVDTDLNQTVISKLIRNLNVNLTTDIHMNDCDTLESFILKLNVIPDPAITSLTNLLSDQYLNIGIKYRVYSILDSLGSRLTDAQKIKVQQAIKNCRIQNSTSDLSMINNNQVSSLLVPTKTVTPFKELLIQLIEKLDHYNSVDMPSFTSTLIFGGEVTSREQKANLTP